MKIFTKSIFACLMILVMVMFVQHANGQSILNPSDSVYTYISSATAGSANNPNQPAANTIGKWIRTVRMSWNTNEYKCYIYNGRPFRLHYPKTYNPTANDGKKYPILIFWHGAGESGPITDNEISLAHGGQTPFQTSVDNGTFDGYIIFMQNQNGAWDPTDYTRMKQITDYMITNNKVDPFRIYCNGLSAGGSASWGMMFAYPQVVAANLPMSSDNQGNITSANLSLSKFTPLWTTQGGQDTWPDPNDASIVNAGEVAAGANWTYTFFPTLGHDTWDSCWLEPNFWPFFVNAYASNPWPLHGQSQFCPGVTPVDTLGVAPGYDGYQWENGTSVISGATTNTLIVNTYGTYSCKVLRNGIWSDWSHTPVVIAVRQPTVTPPITISGLQSFVIPSPSQSNVVLQVPTGYATYVWQQVGSSNTVGSANTLAVTSAGQYQVEVTQTGGCSSSFGTPFTVASATGPNPPDAASGVQATSLSPTSVLVTWNQNPTPAHNEVNFEVYQASKTGGPWKLVGITAADASKDTVSGLTAGTQYYYEVRAVDSTAASAVSNTASVTTTADTQPPTAPGNLSVTGSSLTSITLGWTASTDNVGVAAYDIYVNGVKAYTTDGTQTSFTVYSLQNQANYYFVVKARDAAGNVTASNQVSGQPVLNGIPYLYYDGLPTTLTKLPNFSTLAPASSGTLANISLTPAYDATWFGFLFQGFINIPTTGTYQFRTTSDDASALYLGTLGSYTPAYQFGTTPLVNNDGLHSSTSVTSNSVTLQAGLYPIAISYINATGGFSLTVSWKVPGSGSFVTLPNSAFQQTATVTGTVPNAPSNLVATALSYKAVQLNWTDNSNNEMGFEIWRSTSPANTGATILGTTAAGVTSYIDSTASASTQYFYEIRAINQYGASNFTSNYTEAEFKFNNNYIDSTGNGHTITVVGAPTFDATNKAEGAYSVKLNGTNQALTLNNTAGWLQENYYQRTIATWVKASSTSGSNRVIWDIGGSTNGLSLVLNGTTLEACIASSSTRKQITTTMNNTNWNHIAVVYYGDTLQLYVNGVLAASNNSLGFHSILATTDGARIGQTNGTNALNTTGSYFGGWIDDFGVYNTALTADVINNIKNLTYHQSNATTGVLPAIPTAPGNLTVNATSASAINITWQDTATNVTNFQLYRSNNNNQNYLLLATLPANKFSYTDTGLFANAKYYYKVNAVNAGGASAFTTEGSATTKDIPPVMNAIKNQQARYGTTTVIPVSATLATGGAITLTASNLPASGFAVFTDNGNGTGKLTLNPAQTDSGTYNGITITATDSYGGSSSTQFNLWVNNNYPPTLDSVANYTMNEGDTLNITLSGHNVNPADVLTLAVSGVPNYYTLTQGANGVATLQLRPSYAVSGTYTIGYTVNDNTGFSASRSFSLTVNKKDPAPKIYARVQALSAAPAPWNNMTSPSISNLVDMYGAQTTVGISLNTTFWDPWPYGPYTGSNSGVYPDVVERDYWYFNFNGGPATAAMTISGLNPTTKYNVTLFASSNYSGFADNGKTIYSSQGQSDTLEVQNNTKNTVTLDTLVAAADGTVTINLSTLNNPGYLNAVVIQKYFNDGTAPATPTNLQATVLGGKGVGLTWNAVSYNETNYLVYRSVANTSSFKLLATLPANSSAYTDSSVSGTTQYYYTVAATNSVGTNYSDTAAVLTPDRVPVMATIQNVTLSNTQSTQINVSAVDDSTDHLTLTASGLPPFATFVDNGNGTGVISINPTPGVQGTYNGVTITATDMSDSTSSSSFAINVTDSGITYTYLDFTQTPYLVPAPWNPMNIGWIPYAGFYYSNLLDQTGKNTGITVTMTDGWDGIGPAGERRRNGSDVYPEAAVVDNIYFTSSSAHRITVTGLNPALAYNFQFYNSSNTSTNVLTYYAIGSQTVSLNGQHNSNKTVQINGITPDATGTVVITVTKDAAAAAGILNALVIQTYTPGSNVPFSPTDLRKLDFSKTGSIALQWQDRASNETGYQVWRAPAGGSYTLLATLAAGSTSYVDSNLPANTAYDYTVRAVNGLVYSRYSVPLRAYTYETSVFVFLNRVWPTTWPHALAPAPFNNLNWSYPSAPNVWTNFNNETGLPTNIGMSQPDPWDEVECCGAGTGNNSGVFPDAAMNQSWLNFQGDSSYVIFTGLDIAKTYDFTLFSSVTDDNTGNANTKYWLSTGAGGILNAHQNTTGTLTFFGLKPDANGTIGIGMKAYDSTNSSFGTLGVVVIKGYDQSTNTISPVPTGGANTGVIASTSAAQFSSTADSLQDDKPLTAYPNPFENTLNLNIPATIGENVLVSVTDAAGRTMVSQRFDNLNDGNNVVQLTTVATLPAGVYFVQVLYIDKGTRKTVLVVKKK